ncbi:MAG TPA: amidohydrolase family protein [Pirellulales bacterium]|nr:amidohydrolase family protein [Pirellulales bacterium]
MIRASFARHMLAVFVAFVSVTCVVPVSAAAPWAVHGDIVTERGSRKGTVVFDDSGILGVMYDDTAGERTTVSADARQVEHGGYIFPGLIDCHNHAQWNAIPSWRSDRKYRDRYEWQNDRAYEKKVKQPYYAQIERNNLSYAALKYAEIRAVVGGTTALQSSYPVDVPPLLVRNLDSEYQTDSKVTSILQTTPEERFRFRLGLASGKIRRIFLHVAEGRRDDLESRSEFGSLTNQGWLRPGIVVIHGTALSGDEFQQMPKNGVGLVWSPRSNLVLYGETTNIADAIDQEVIVALAPDWSITGSNNALEEMKFAHAYSKARLPPQRRLSAQRLFKMVTVDAAKVAGLEERLGAIRHGNAADLVLAPKLHGDPFESLLLTFPRHIQLVFIDGVPVYGDVEQLLKFGRSNGEVDEILVEGVPKGICLVGDPKVAWHATQHYNEVRKILESALDGKLAPLIEDHSADDRVLDEN